MPIYTQKFKDILNIQGSNVLASNSGRVLWIGNSPKLVPGEIPASDTNLGDFYHPLATLGQAMIMLSSTSGSVLCGDIIFIKPGVTLTITTATGLLVTASGVRIIGIGDLNSMPAISLQQSSSAGIHFNSPYSGIYNVRIISNVNVAFTTAAITIAAIGAQVVGCSFEDGISPMYGAINIIGGSSNSTSNSQIRDNSFMQMQGNNGAILFSEITSGIIISGNMVMGTFSGGLIKNPLAVCSNLIIMNNILSNSFSNKPIMNIIAASTGILMNNQMNGQGTPTNTIGSLTSSNNSLGTTNF